MCCHVAGRLLGGVLGNEFKSRSKGLKLNALLKTLHKDNYFLVFVSIYSFHFDTSTVFSLNSEWHTSTTVEGEDQILKIILFSRDTNRRGKITSAETFQWSLLIPTDKIALNLFKCALLCFRGSSGRSCSPRMRSPPCCRPGCTSSSGGQVSHLVSWLPADLSD